MSTAIHIEDVSKQYRLGQVGTGTISHDLNRWWHRVRGKEDPYSQVGQENRRDQAAESEYVWALKDINLKVEQGEVLGIIGANGAGKSTLLKLVSRITSPTTGAIKAKGRIASLLEVGTGMHPEMTARENIYLNGSILGMRRHEITRKFDEIIDFSGCRMYVDTPVKRYSSGMRVRLAFAVAAFLQSEIIILDEVLAVGDAQFQQACLSRMQEVRDGGRTIVFVSHNMNSVRSVCENAIVLTAGLSSEKMSADDAIRVYSATKSKSQRSGTPHRTGTRKVTFDSFAISNSSNHSLLSGEPLALELTLNNRDTADREMHIQLFIRSPLNQQIARIVPSWVNRSFTTRIPRGTSQWRLRADVPYLEPGEYTLALWASHNGVVSDFIRDAYTFTIHSEHRELEFMTRSENNKGFLLKATQFDCQTCDPGTTL